MYMYIDIKNWLVFFLKKEENIATAYDRFEKKNLNKNIKIIDLSLESRDTCNPTISMKYDCRAYNEKSFQ